MVKVIITIYYAIAAQTDSTPKIPACPGYIMEEGKNYIALSRNFYEESTYQMDYLECGDLVQLCCNECPYEGEYVVVDKMNARFNNYVDVFSNPSKPYGLWKGSITKLNENNR